MSDNILKISVIGTGSWGTALGVLLAKKGHDVTFCSMTEQKYRELCEKHENVTALPGVKLPENVNFTMDMEEAVKGSDCIIFSVASVFTREIAQRMEPYVDEGQIIVSVGKGIEENSFLMLEGVIKDEIPRADVAVLSGPSHAEEVGRGIPTTCVIGAETKETALFLQNLFMSDSFRVYINPDMLGISLGGALKNIIALAAGIADGLGYGDNTKAALITRGIAEISRLGVAMGAHPATFSGLTGIGDLIVTCASMHSRNRKAGILIGQGKSLEEAQKEVSMVVEGVYAAKAAKQLADKYGVEMPIVNEVNKVLFDGKDPAEAVMDLMLRDNVIESEDISWGER